MVFDAFQIQWLWQILLAAVLGAVIGFEREHKKKEAGFRTFSLVALGACLFTVLGLGFQNLGDYPLVQLDLTRIIQAVAIGIGFIGGGLIIFRREHVEGLTTAAALWVTAAIGITVGLKLFLLAVLGTLLTVVILTGFSLLEEKLFS